MEKTRINKGQKGYNYKYTDLAQINEYCEERGITYYQYIDYVVAGEQVIDYIMTVIIKGGKEQEPKRGVRLVNAVLKGIENPAQEQGSATTYARRYSLLMALGLATEDDDAQSLTKTKETKATLTQLKNIKELYTTEELLDITKTTADKLDEYMKNLTITKASDLIAGKRGK